ncbi:hypothetical protein B0H14DRAFT_2927127 [Mycena olivaceomarginata]|nr:hypothetical protein B0H14DRAFT_2927127 [Mycena olivaceomarginata]
MDRWDACDAHGAGEWGTGFGYLHWFLAARLLLVYRGVKDVIQQASIVLYGLRSERRICGILVAAPRPRPPPSGSWRGLREPYAPLFRCRVLRALPPAAHILGWAPARFPLPSRLFFRRCAHISQSFTAAGSSGALGGSLDTSLCGLDCLVRVLFPVGTSLFVPASCRRPVFPIKPPNSFFFVL